MNKSIVFNRYGSIANLELQDLPEPKSVKKGHALIKVDAIGINPRDIVIAEGKFKFLSGSKFPKLTGADFSGTIIKLPPNAGGFSVGDSVFGYHDSLKGGVSTQICSIPLKYLVLRPEEMKSTTAAAVGCTYLTAYQGLVTKAGITSGNKVIVFGASGGVGTAAVQLAGKFGAKVTAVSHSKNETYCLSQGADNFIAYDKQDIFNLNERYDVFFQVFSDNGNLYSKGKSLLTKDGLYLSLIPNPLTRLAGYFKKPKSDFVMVKSNKDHLMDISKSIVTGQIKPYIDKVYDLSNFGEAFTALTKGEIKGKAVISLNP